MAIMQSGTEVDSLSEAIDVYRDDAAEMYVEAHDGLPRKPAVPAQPAVPAHDGVPAKPAVAAIPEESPEDAKNRSQTQLAAAFSQLSTAAMMRSAQDGRDGYADVVKLMKTTRLTATVLCRGLRLTAKALTTTATTGQLTTTATTAPATAQGDLLDVQLQIFDALTKALQALAQIAPTAVWEKPSDGAAG